MKSIKLICLLLVLTFITIGCENKSTKLPEPTEPAKLSEPTKLLHEAPADGDSNQVKSLLSKQNQESPYLQAVRTFADNVLKHGRDTYGPKQTPLFVDGVNVNTHEPVKWIASDGEKWVLSNLTSQQNLFRVLDGLTKITGDPKYKQSAMQAIKYAFENLRSPNGLLYWGGYEVYDALSDEPRGGGLHVFKGFFPYYQLMWEVDPEITKDIIESLWAAHIVDWSRLEMDRIGSLELLRFSKGWEHEYKGGPVFFESSRRPFATTGCDLYYAAAILSRLSGNKDPLIWAKRLVYRYVETRDPKVGISTYVYTLRNSDPKHPLADDFKGHRFAGNILFPAGIEQMLNPMVRECKLGYFTVSPGVPYTYVSSPWTCSLLVGELVGDEGMEFTQWALEDLTSRGKVAYRPIDNVWIPMLPDGMSLEGYAYKKDVQYGPKGTVFKPISAVPMDFWGYSLAYRLTHDEFMREMACNIAMGIELGDIGATAKDKPTLQIPVDHFDPYSLLAFLELYRETGVTSFLQAAQEVGDNILAIRFHKGFFIPSSQHINTKFDNIEALALLHLGAAMRGKGLSVPQVWPGRPLFIYPFRDKEAVVDNSLLYTLTESAVPPRSLHEAAACGDIEEAKSLIAEGANVNGLEGVALYTPLYHATLNGHKEVVELLLANGAQVNAINGGQGTALQCALVKSRHVEIVKLLISAGADVNVKDDNGRTPLLYAVRNNDVELVKLFLSAGADADIVFENAYPLLYYAVFRGNVDMVKLLVENGARVDAKLPNGRTVIQSAASQGRREIVEVLISQGVDASSLHMAAYAGDVAGVRSLIEQGADVNAKDEGGWTPLFWATCMGRAKVAELLITQGADVTLTTNNQNTALHQAAEAGESNIAQLLIAHGADVNAKDKRGYTPLYYAILIGRVGIVEALATKDADVNLRTENGYSLLHLAIWNESVDIVKLLVDYGAQFNEKDPDGWTAFYNAVWSGNRELVDVFISKGADISTFHMTAAMGDMVGINAFLEQGFAVDVKDEMEYTPLSWATCMGQAEVVKLLIAQGADVNLKIYGQATALHQAVRVGDGDIVQLLITQGADVKAKNEAGQTPFDYARRGKHEEIIELLKKHGAKE